MTAMLKTLMMRAMVSCREATRLSSEARDRKLSPCERLRLRFHMLMCVFCRRYERQLGFLHVALHRHTSHVALSEEARARIRRALQSGS